MHGIAVNVANDLSLFDCIIPCGLKGMKMCSVQSFKPNVTLNEYTQDGAIVLLWIASVIWRSLKSTSKLSILRVPLNRPQMKINCMIILHGFRIILLQRYQQRRRMDKFVHFQGILCVGNGQYIVCLGNLPGRIHGTLFVGNGQYITYKIL